MTSTRWDTARFILVSIAALLTVIDPGRSIWYVGFASIAYLLHRISHTPFRAAWTLEFLVFLFLLTAAVGIWTAYDPDQAILKAARLALSVLLMAAVLQVPFKDSKLVLITLGLLGVGLSFGFVLSNIPPGQSSDFELIIRARQWFAALMPGSRSSYVDPNLVAGVLAFTLPVLLGAGIQSITQTQPIPGFSYLFLAVIQLIGLVLTSSRGAWVALSSAPIIIVGAYGGVKLWRQRGRSRRVVIFGVTLFVLLGVAMLIFGASGIGRAIGHIPGAPTLGERVGLYKDTLDLVSDYAFTGGGLAAFSGLYSYYIRVIPFHYFRYSHNLYLDLALEQGIFGLIAALGFFAVVIRACIVSIADHRAQGRPVDYLAWGSLVGFTAVLIHGLGDDPLYGLSGTPLLFVPPALALYFSGTWKSRIRAASSEPQVALNGEKAGITFHKGSVLILLAILAIVGVFWRLFSSGITANIAAVELAKAELAGWEGEGWDDVGDLVARDEILAGFQTALRFDPDQVTALYRIGRIALSQLDFDEAVFYLQHAHVQNPTHRGITKQLGYALVWDGKIEQGITFLQRIPEALEELNTYSWWWTTQDETELSLLASEAATRMVDPTYDTGK